MGEGCLHWNLWNQLCYFILQILMALWSHLLIELLKVNMFLYYVGLCTSENTGRSIVCEWKYMHNRPYIICLSLQIYDICIYKYEILNILQGSPMNSISHGFVVGIPYLTLEIYPLKQAKIWVYCLISWDSHLWNHILTWWSLY